MSTTPENEPRSPQGGAATAPLDPPAWSVPPAAATPPEGSVPPTYPPAVGNNAGGSGPSGPGRGGSRVLAVTLGVIGGVAVLGAAGMAAAGTVASNVFTHDVTSEAEQVAAGGAGLIDVSVSAGSIRIEFGDVDEAVLDSSSGYGSWRLTRDGDTISVKAPDRQWVGIWWDHFEASAVLTLPREMAGADLDLDVSFGDVVAAGDFGDVSYELGAGDLEITGSARTLDADVSAGNSTIELRDLQAASFEVGAGDVYGNLRGGEAPQHIDLDVSAGSLELQLPDVPYAVTSETAFGDFTSNLDTQSGAPRTIDVELAAGDITLSAG